MFLGYKHVDIISDYIGNGCTEPMNAIIDSSIHAVIKVNNNCQGNLVLFNEYVCFKLCELLNIPIPDAGVGMIDGDTQYDMSRGYISESNYGLCFYSKRIDKATILNSLVIPLITNKEKIYDIILFDHIVYNKDRNLGNILVTSSSEVKLYAIDHTHTFKNQTIWEANCLIQGIQDEDYRDNDILMENKDVYQLFRLRYPLLHDKLESVSESFAAVLTRENIDGILESVPKEWRVSRADAVALTKYLLYRTAHIPDLCDIILRGGQ